MKILPSDDLSHKPDYNRNYKKYFKEELVDYSNTQSTKGLLLPSLKNFLQQSNKKSVRFILYKDSDWWKPLLLSYKKGGRDMWKQVKTVYTYSVTLE